MTITLKYSGKCKACGARLSKGTVANWHGKGSGVTCLDCTSYNTRDGQSPRVSYVTTSGGSFASCNCEDYPCCGH